MDWDGLKGDIGAPLMMSVVRYRASLGANHTFPRSEGMSLGLHGQSRCVCEFRWSLASSNLGCFLGVDDSQGPQPKLRSVTFKSVGKSDQVFNGNNEDGNIL